MPSHENNGIKIMPKSSVCEDSILRGDITISSGCVVHPSASILAEAGPIILGENCIVEEYATIANRLSENSKEKMAGQTPSNNTLIIGANNVFEVGCTVEAMRIGDKNVFEPKCYVGPEIVVTNGCVIGAGAHMKYTHELSENSVVYGRNCLQRDAIDKHTSQTLQIDFLRKVFPNYHRLKKPNYDARKSRSAI